MIPHPAELIADALEALAAEASIFEASAARAAKPNRLPLKILFNIHEFVALSHGIPTDMLQWADILTTMGDRAFLLSTVTDQLAKKNPGFLALELRCASLQQMRRTNNV